MKLYTIMDMDAEKCGPIFTAENEAVCMRLIYSQYKDMPVHISSRMEVLELAELEVSTGYLSGRVCSWTDEAGFEHVKLGANSLLTIEDIVNSFKKVEDNDSQH